VFAALFGLAHHLQFICKFSISPARLARITISEDIPAARNMIFYLAHLLHALGTAR